MLMTTSGRHLRERAMCEYLLKHDLRSCTHDVAEGRSDEVLCLSYVHEGD